MAAAALERVNADQKRCDAEECLNARRTKLYCATHARRAYRSPGVIDLSPIRQRNPDSYSAVHRRLSRVYGPALQFRCALCDGTAAQWAYDHTDPDPLTSPSRRTSAELEYSRDLSRYLPMCLACHVLFDLLVAAVNRGARLSLPVLGQQFRRPL
jgi:hypothetical protein